MTIGDRVDVLDDTISGVIIAVDDDVITVETTDGFPLKFQKKELVIVDVLPITSQELTQAKREKQLGYRKNKSKSSKKQRAIPPMEVDLHIHHLARSTKSMSNFEMLNLQLDTAQEQLEFAIRKHIQRIVFIHGVGKGVLRAELETLFRRYDQVAFYDADYTKYGRGATEVYIYQNY